MYKSINNIIIKHNSILNWISAVNQDWPSNKPWHAKVLAIIESLFN